MYLWYRHKGRHAVIPWSSPRYVRRNTESAAEDTPVASVYTGFVSNHPSNNIKSQVSSILCFYILRGTSFGLDLMVTNFARGEILCGSPILYPQHWYPEISTSKKGLQMYRIDHKRLYGGTLSSKGSCGAWLQDPLKHHPNGQRAILIIG
jgi:hypothetical protein